MDQVETAIEKAGSHEFGLYDLAETAQQNIARTLSSDPGWSDEQTAPSESGETSSEPDADSPESYVISPVQ